MPDHGTANLAAAHVRIVDSAGLAIDPRASVPAGDVASGSTDAGNPIKVGGVYNSTPPTLDTGDRGDMQQDARGNVKTAQFLGAEALVGNVGDYEAVAASATDQILGATGAVGDFLEKLIIVVATAATAAVSIKDGNGSAISIMPNSPGGGIGVYVVPIGAKCVNATTPGWKVTTGAGVSVIGIGTFT